MGALKQLQQVELQYEALLILRLLLQFEHPGV
jgi:hypothetical protein